MRFVNGSFRAGKSLWRMATEHGRSVGAVNVPMTYPAEEVNGFVIAGPDAPSQDAPGFCSPPDLVREVVKATGLYVIEAGASSLVRQGRPAEALRALEESIRARTEVARWLVRHHPTDLFMITFTEADRVQHHFWKYVNPQHPASPDAAGAGLRRGDSPGLRAARQGSRGDSACCRRRPHGDRRLRPRGWPVECANPSSSIAGSSRSGSSASVVTNPFPPNFAGRPSG